MGNNGLNSGYIGTDQRRTKAGSYDGRKHYLERLTGGFLPLWDPSQITTSLWLDSSDINTLFLQGTSVTQWNDKSGNGLNCFQSTSTNRPIIIYSELNSYNILRFVNSDYLSSTSNLNLTSGFTIFVVAKNRIRKNYNGLFRVGAVAMPSNDVSNLEIYWQQGSTDAGSGNIVTVGNRNINFKGDQTDNALPAVNNYYIHSAQASGTTFATRYINGTLLGSNQNYGTGSVVPSSSNPYHVGVGYAAAGNVASACLDGDICEIVVLNTVATTQSRQIMEGYLAWKWGLESNLPADHPYKYSPPQ